MLKTDCHNYDPTQSPYLYWILSSVPLLLLVAVISWIQGDLDLTQSISRSPSALNARPISKQAWKLTAYKQLSGNISLSFRGNKKVWGTYDLIGENYQLNENKKKYKNAVKSPGTLTYSKGHTVIIREVESIQRKAVKVLALPIEKFKRQKGLMRYELETQSSSGELHEHFSAEISRLASKIVPADFGPLNLDRSMIEFDKMTCTRRKTNINCQLPIKILIPDSYKATRHKNLNSEWQG